MSDPKTAPILEARDIIKRFGGVVALGGVCLDLRPGEIHALCGENGAGKSTLIKTLGGVHPFGSYEGGILVEGKRVQFDKIADAEAVGICVIHQELALVPQLSVAENIYLGREPTWHGLIDWPVIFRNARELLKKFEIDIAPDGAVNRLGVGHQQLVEIVRALGKESRILILDEPTAALSEQEVRILLQILVDLKKRGISMIYISHRLDEVFEIADRITVLRDGKSITTLDAKQTDKATVIRHMVGREIQDLFPRRQSHVGEVRLSVQGVCVDDAMGDRILQDISFEVRQGEVLGIGGLMGAGRSELLMNIFGAFGKRVAGEVKLDGAAFEKVHPQSSIDRGLVLVTEDRKRYGLILEQSISFNLSLSSMKTIGMPLIDPAGEVVRNREVFDSLQVKAPDMELLVKRLSGGNQQKVVLGKALLTKPRVIFLDEPTRGIDVGAKVEVYELINRLTQEGLAVVLVSSEMPELMGMSDRIVMLHEGKIGGRFTRAEATQERLLAAAMGQ